MGLDGSDREAQPVTKLGGTSLAAASGGFACPADTQPKCLFDALWKNGGRGNEQTKVAVVAVVACAG